MQYRKLIGMTLIAITLSACASQEQRVDQGQIDTVQALDLKRFMGGWHVIGVIPWLLESGNVGTEDRYRMKEDGSIAVQYLYRDGSFDEPVQWMKGSAEVVDGSGNGHWQVQFIWPLKFDYMVIAVDEDYQLTAIAHPSRNYGWIMARSRTISDADYERMLAAFAEQGYDTSRFRKVPQLRRQMGEPGFLEID